MTWMGPGTAARMAIDLQRCGWKVRQIAGRRIWYKGQAGAEIVAKGMQDALNMELTLRRTMAPSLFMYGPAVAELLGALPPTPPEKPKHKARRIAAATALDHLNSATFGNEAERDLYEELTAPARKILGDIACNRV